MKPLALRYEMRAVVLITFINEGEQLFDEPRTKHFVLDHVQNRVVRARRACESAHRQIYAHGRAIRTEGLKEQSNSIGRLDAEVIPDGGARLGMDHTVPARPCSRPGRVSELRAS